VNHIRIIPGDITKAKVDAIVNAANPVMLGGGGVDGAIHLAAGPKLLEACHQVESVAGIRCPFGQARITTAGNLDAKYVIHTVGPIYQTDSHPGATLAAAYENSLKLAQEYNCHSIAFPAISCGVYGYPLAEAANIALSVCGRKAYGAIDIQFHLFSEEITALWRAELEAAAISNRNQDVY